MGLSTRSAFSLATDLVVFSFEGEDLRLLLVRRANPPFQGGWALPGGFLESGETLEQCARRELEEETGVDLPGLQQLAAFSEPGRDPRGDVISVAFLAVIRAEDVTVTAGSDAADAVWRPISDLPPLAFDHDLIVAAARARLASVLERAAEAASVLPEALTLADLDRLRARLVD